MQIMTLSKLLECIGTLNWRGKVFFPSTKQLSKQSFIAVLEAHDIEESQTVKLCVSSYALTCKLPVSTVQDIVENAKLQIENIYSEDLIKAVKFYINNDAFIDLIDKIDDI